MSISNSEQVAKSRSRRLPADTMCALAIILAAACSPTSDSPNPCEGELCSGHGFCEVQQGQAVCLCENGFYVDGLECLESPPSCDASSCAGHGDCDDSTGELLCTCDDGYTGDGCEQCAEGYHRDGGASGGTGDCVPDEVDECDPDPCDGYDCGNGSCRCVGGEASCSCDEGWAGDRCDTCASDYHQIDGEPGCWPCNELKFSYDAPSNASSVWLTGSFTNWAETVEAGAIPMTREAGDTWSVITPITPAGDHLYKFVIDGTEWVHDPDNPLREEDPYGGYNSILQDVCEFGSVCGEVDVPDWRDLVMYFVMVDRFFDSDGQADTVPGASAGGPQEASGQYMGGDIPGVTAKLDYLNDLGVTAIWLSAPYDNRDTAGAAIEPHRDDHMYSGYHGYWPSPANIDYSDPLNPSPTPQVESRIGTAADLQAFVDAAHGSAGANGEGIRVLFDYVMNHVDDQSGLFQAHSSVDDPWFARNRDDHFVMCSPDMWDDPTWGTHCAFTPYLPPFDFDEAGPRSWSVNDAIWWATTFGIDGYRLDAIKHVPMEWLTQIRDALDVSITDPWAERFYLVGETFAYQNPGLISSFVDPAERLDGQFDFPFKAQLCNAVLAKSQGLDRFSTWMDDNDIFYHQDAIMTTWIGNHDIPRAIHFASGQITNCEQGSNPENGWSSGSYQQPQDGAPYERLALTYVVMMTSRGIPLIYYGDEIGLAGGGDPDNRRMMIWDDGLLNAHQRQLRETLATLAYIRAENPVLSRGSRRFVSADADTWVYTMGCGGSEVAPVTVALNRADSSQTVSIPAGSYTDLMTDSSYAGGSTELPARGFRILRHD